MEKKNNKKLLIILISVAVIIMVGIVAAIFLKKEEGYRMIRVHELMGEATVERANIGSMNAYENLNLLSGDKLTTKLESYTRLKLDDDKYLLAEEDSVLEMVATGNDKKARTNINLLKGAVTIEVQNKLNEDSSFEVTTPNSVMAIRGTVFRVKVDVDEAGKPITRVSIFEGAVGVQKKDKDGNLTEEEIIPSSKEALIYFEDDEEVLIILDEIDVSDVPLEALEFLEEISEGGRELSMSLERIREEIENRKREQDTEESVEENAEIEELEVFTVNFTYKGSLFGSQEVKSGEFATKPALIPAPSGHWNFDFNTPITQDTEIEFIE